MDPTLSQAALAVEHRDCPNCHAPAGSACRTRGGKTAAKHHTARFVLVPALREELDVPVPADRGPGRAWKQGPALAVVPAPRAERPVRIGYARTSTARQELASRPELEKALAPAHQFKGAAPDTSVIFTVHELKRLARNAAELMTLSAELQAGGIQLELLTGPLTGIHDPNGMGAMFFAVALKDKGVTVPEIAKKLTIKTGKNAGKSPSVASLYRALAEAEQAAADDDVPLRPEPVRIRHPEDPLTPKESDLRERLQAQPHPNAQGAPRG
ncbi:zinc finger domain-containing protein [Streptomyces atratus]|uniref:zinc finger domain-containing protein n=1 Tax=Streptomyces atratus TaxID=1893 RepID=UPI0022509338|nr:recombinase family protein [Streptomyces atratus]MCX5340162.1 recombinase family protein [Streptomyces atratus]